MNKLSSRTALRRLLIILAFAIGLIIFSYGWSVTQINLDRPQEPLRQQNAGNALRELLSPNVLEQDYDFQAATTPVLMDCPVDGSQPTFDTSESSAPAEGEPRIVVSPTCASSNEFVTVQGYDFFPDSLARINWIATDGQRRVRQVVGVDADNFITNDDGTFTVQIEVPRIRGTAGETHTIEAQGAFPTGTPRFTDTSGLVLQKMIETVFLALIATSLSILPAAVLSFFAAHNLMRPVKMSLGNLLVSFALLPIGWFLGTSLLGHLGTLGVNLGKGAGFSTSAASVATLFLFSTVTSSRIRPSNINLTENSFKGGVEQTSVWSGIHIRRRIDWWTGDSFWTTV